jgi:hypothetical protein
MVEVDRLNRGKEESGQGRSQELDIGGAGWRFENLNFSITYYTL